MRSTSPKLHKGGALQELAYTQRCFGTTPKPRKPEAGRERRSILFLNSFSDGIDGVTTPRILHHLGERDGRRRNRRISSRNSRSRLASGQKSSIARRKHCKFVPKVPKVRAPGLPRTSGSRLPPPHSGGRPPAVHGAAAPLRGWRSEDLPAATR